MRSQVRKQAVSLAGVYPSLGCERRVPVSADLSQGAWPGALEAAGFDPARPSFFLLEGLLMCAAVEEKKNTKPAAVTAARYLPDDGSVQRLLARAAALMAPGSHVAGDSFVQHVRMIRDPDHGKAFAPIVDVLRKYSGRLSLSE